jgi:hypothetical protein
MTFQYSQNAIELLKELKNSNKNWIPDYNETKIKNIITEILNIYTKLQNNLQ